jgi:hypothetical protein
MEIVLSLIWRLQTVPLPQFRSVRSAHMLNITMRKSPVATKTSGVSNSSNKRGAAAAEVALKAHVLGSAPEILAEMTEGDRMIREIGDVVDLTEAPEDAVCSLVTVLRAGENRLDSRGDVAGV